MKEFENKLVNVQIKEACKEDDIGQIAKLYAEVFAGPPWNEYTKCISGCNKFFGLNSKPGDLCPNKDGVLTLAYPESETKDYITKEMSNPNPIMLIGKDNGLTVGFTWGYSYPSPVKFVEEKYKTKKMRNTIINILENEGINGSFFYCSETGIIDSYRGLGLTNLFYKKRLDLIKNLNLPILSRTNCNSPMVAVAETFNMKQIMGPQMTVDRANKRIAPRNILANNCLDTEIEERVLFVLQ